MKRVVEMALAYKHNEELFFENRAGAMLNNIFPDDEAKKVFNDIQGNITGVYWEAEPLEQEI